MENKVSLLEERLNGWLILNKPKGISSAAAVAKVKKLVKKSKVGHAGTLDPLASGILPIAIGEATRTVEYFMAASKAYLFDLTFGQSTATGDAEGEIIMTSPVIPTLNDIVAILPKFTGEIMQTPPIYSAIKVQGERAYHLARKGEVPHLAARNITINKLEVKETESKNTFRFQVECSKGTYIRSLASDIAVELKTCGFVSYLHRLRVGRFSDKEALPLDFLLPKEAKAHLINHLLPVRSVLDDIPVLQVTTEQTIALQQGRKIYVAEGQMISPMVKLVQAVCKEQLIALCVWEGEALQPYKVFNF